MKRVALILILAAALFTGCKKSSDSSDPAYSNKIAFGTGLNPSNLFELTGVGTSFGAASLIYFRLESADDMAGSTVRLVITKGDGSAYESIDYPNPQSYGHIMVSTLYIYDAGSYKVTGMLVTGSKTIASQNITIYFTDKVSQ
jgi:hypothetical protein